MIPDYLNQPLAWVNVLDEFNRLQDATSARDGSSINSYYYLCLDFDRSLRCVLKADIQNEQLKTSVNQIISFIGDHISNCSSTEEINTIKKALNIFHQRVCHKYPTQINPNKYWKYQPAANPTQETLKSICILESRLD